MNEQVTSAAELDALPVGSVVMEGDSGEPFEWVVPGVQVMPGVFHRFPDGWYVVAGHGVRLSEFDLGPLTVLYRPDQPQRVQPSREDVEGALIGARSCVTREVVVPTAAEAVLALFAQQPTVAEVKAEALREAANDENSEWARKRTEDELIEFRDARIGLVNRRNGLVVYERDGEPSSIIRLGFEMAWKSALRDLADRIEREARP